MSIVDKTLQRLDGGSNPAPVAEPVAAPLHSVERDLLYVAGARKRRTPWALWLALLLLAVAGLVYFGLQQSAPPAAPGLQVPPQLPPQLGHAIEPPRPPLEAVAPVPSAAPTPAAEPATRVQAPQLRAPLASAPPLADTAAPAQRLQLPGPPPLAAAASGPATPASAAPPLDAATAQAAPVSAPLAADPAPATPATPATPARPDRRDWENRANQARELLRQGAFVLVVEHAEGMTRDFPDRWEPWFWLGTAALSRGQLDPAEQALDRALALNAGVAQVWIQRGIVAQERADHTAAARFLTQATSLAPRMPEAHLNLGFSFDALGRTSETERSFRSFLQLTEGNATYALQRQHIQDWLARR